MHKQKSSSALRAAAGSVEMVQTLEGRVMLSITPVATPVTISWQGHTVETYAGQYIIQTQHLTKFQSLAAKKGFTDVKSLGGLGDYSFNSDLPLASLQKLAASVKDTISLFEPNIIHHIASTSTNDPLLVNQWGMSNTGQTEPYDYNGDGVVTPYNEIQNPTPPTVISYPSPPYPNENKVGTVGADIDASQAWDLTTGSKSVVVAVLDSGIDLNHPDLVSNIWTNPLDTAANGNNGDGYPNDVHGWNFVADNNDVTDDNGHGTNVSGIIGAVGNNGQGVTGVDWNVSLLPVKVADASGSIPSGTEIAGLNYCINLKAHGINIVAMNESLGGSIFPLDLMELGAIAAAGKAGILDVVAAGNDGANLDLSESTPGKLSAAGPTVITVGAVDDQFKLATFSNFGATSVDLAAPGIDIFSTSPTYSVTLNNEVAMSQPDIPQFSQTYGYLSGTSQATPSVAGIIALEAAANPLASPAELKRALLQGVTYDPQLAATNGSPALVATSGVANAFKAVQNILNDYVGTNTAHQGNWVNFYGSSGAYVVGESTSFPSFVNVTQTGGAPVVLSNSTKDLAGLQRVSDPTQRVSAYEATAGVESINLQFTDGHVHETTIYAADLDHQKRIETIAIYDTATNTLLNYQTISNFNKGQYLTWDLRGSVTMVITKGSGPNAVYSGLFFDTPAAAPTTYQSTDTTTTGQNWRNQYGSQGSVVTGDQSVLPSYISTFSLVGTTGTILRAKTRASVALQKVTDVNSGIEATWSSATHLDLNLAVNDGLAHIVTLYMADYDHKHRQQRIQVIDSATGSVLTTQDISNFSNGLYMSFRIAASTTFRITNTGGPSAVLSGFFFDAPYGEGVHFLGIDTTTRGDWKSSQYGNFTSYVVGDNFPGFDNPANTSIQVTGATENLLNFAKPVISATALLKATSQSTNQNIEAYLSSPTSMVVAYDPRDDVQHTVALYFADYQNTHRLETVTIYNPATLQVLTRQTISNFAKGKYLTFDEQGQLLITISNGGYPNAVLSGVFTN